MGRVNSKAFNAWIQAGRPKKTEEKIAYRSPRAEPIRIEERAAERAVEGEAEREPTPQVPSSPPPPAQARIPVSDWPTDLLRAAAMELVRRQRRIAEEIERALQ